MQNSDERQKPFLGGVFDRQVRIHGWRQDLVAQQTVLLLGVGGLGSAVVINLLRLGVKKLFLVDYDIVDHHNLNRQLLYGPADVGRRKIECALEKCKEHNVGGTQVKALDGNALQHWPEIVAMARESNAIFNLIDFGDSFDLAVQSLALSLSVPLIVGGVFSMSASVDFFLGEGCYLCATDLNPQMVARLSPDKIQGLANLQFLKRNDNPVGQSNVLLCTMCAQLMVAKYLNHLIEGVSKSSRTIFYVNSFEKIDFGVPKSARCKYCNPRAEVFRVLHFNDVYDIEESEAFPEGGVHNFKAAMFARRTEQTLCLFSGDAFSPSTIGFTERGEQMILPLNSLKIDAACFGNHDFDYQLQHTIYLKGKTNFPWLLANYFDSRTKKPLAGAQEYKLLYTADLKIGVFGVGDQSWYQTLQYIEDICYAEPCLEHALRLAKHLKVAQRCDLVVALTHCQNDKDFELAEKVPELDLVLGGHNHIILEQLHKGVLIIKSGSNFKHFSTLKFYHKEFAPEGSHLLGKVPFAVVVEKVDVGKAENPDPELKAYLEATLAKCSKDLEKVIGFTDVDLDCSFGSVRGGESLMGNFTTDLMRINLKVDLAIANSGYIRHDYVIPKGPIRLRQLFKFIEDIVTWKEVTGAKLLQVLEEGIAKYPMLQGRFPCISGGRLVFSKSAEPFKRIRLLEIGGEPVDPKRLYRIGGNSFVINGCDGYSGMKAVPQAMKATDAQKNINLIYNFFQLKEKKLVLSSTRSKISLVQEENRLVSRYLEIGDQQFIVIEPRLEGRIQVVE